MLVLIKQFSKDQGKFLTKTLVGDFGQDLGMASPVVGVRWWLADWSGTVGAIFRDKEEGRVFTVMAVGSGFIV